MFILILSVLAFIGSLTWMIVEPGYEPAIGIVTSLIGVLTAWVQNKKKDAILTKQTQTVGDHSIGIQAGGNVQIDNLKN